jgi:hypothetical protein
MRNGFLKLRFGDDGDGTGKLFVEAQVAGYAGEAGAYFDVDTLKSFASAIGQFPLPDPAELSISSGFGETAGKPAQEHVGLDVYLIDQRGHIGIHVRMATEVWDGTRPESQRASKLEIITTYEPLAKFSNELVAVINGDASEATLEGELLR